MIIFPAIDIKDGIPVRLTRGDFATTEQVADNAVRTAQNFESEGAAHLHMVDLDGALAGEPVNDAVVKDVRENTKLFIQVGGGIRTEETVDHYLNKIKVDRVILGSVAIKDPDFAKKMIVKYGEKIAIGIDAKNGKVSGGGWLEDSEVDYIDLACAMRDVGAMTIIYTDIAKDGTLEGPDLEGLKTLNMTLNEAVIESKKRQTTHVIASGGVATIEDIKALKSLALAGAICGKSLYKGTLSLKEALFVSQSVNGI